MSGNTGINSNEKAEPLTTTDANSKMVEPEPTFGVPSSQDRKAVTDGCRDEKTQQVTGKVKKFFSNPRPI